MSAEQAKPIKVAKVTESAPTPARLWSMDEIEKAFDELIHRPWLSPLRLDRLPELRLQLETRLPKLDVVDRDSEIVVRVEVPGVRREDIDISVSGNLFTVKGTTKHEEKEEKGDYYRCETARGSFSRTITLPAEVNDAGAKAQLREGVLEVTLPKVEKAKKRPIVID